MKHRINLKVIERIPVDRFFHHTLDRAIGVKNPSILGFMSYYDPDSRELLFELQSIANLTYCCISQKLWDVLSSDYNLTPMEKTTLIKNYMETQHNINSVYFVYAYSFEATIS